MTSFHIGKLKAKAELVLASGTLKKAKLSLLDFRLGKILEVSDSLIGSLLPDFREDTGIRAQRRFDHDPKSTAAARYRCSNRSDR